VHETARRAPTVEALHPAPAVEAPHSAPAVEAPHPRVETAHAPRVAEAEPEAPAVAAPVAHGSVRTSHRAIAHRRYAKRERHEKQARHEKRPRHEKRGARPTQLAVRGAPAASADGDARATYERGNALLFAGDAAGAVAAYRKAVELAPADPIGYRGLGLAYEQQGQAPAAIRALRKYLKLAPGAADREIISRRIERLGHAATK
jgi:tetratricopeptide (TPR) repeat protein